MLVTRKPPIIYKNFFSLRKMKEDNIWSKVLFYKDGGDALISSLRKLDIQPGASILIPAFICQSVPNKLRLYDYKPFFIDVTSDLKLQEDIYINTIESNPRKLFWKLNRVDAAGNSNTTMPSKSFYLE